MERYVVAALACVLVGVLAPGTHASSRIPAGPRYAFQQVGEDQGLGTRGVVSITQDGQGLMWFGTLDSLFRYDGHTLRAYSTEDGLPSPYVIQLLTAPDGTLWVATSEGIAYFDGLVFIPVDMSFEAGTGERQRLEGQRIAFDSANNLYVASTRGVVKIGARDRASAQVWSRTDGLPAEEVTAVTTDADDMVWFGCGGRVGVLDPREGGIEMLPVSAGVPDEEIRAILAAPDGTVWVRTITHLARRDPGETVFVLDDEGMPKSNIYGQPTLDGSGSILLPTLVGLYTRQEGLWSVVSEENGLVTSVVSSAYEDHEGALWLGLAGAGLVRWAGRASWSAWTVSEGLPHDAVWGSHRDGRGRLWVGTNSGVAVWDPGVGSWQLRGEADGVSGPVIWHFAEDEDGWVWSISSSGMLTRFEPETLTPEKVEWPAGHEALRATMDTGPDGTIWIGTNDTLHRVAVVDGQVALEDVPLPEEIDGLTLYVEVAPDGTMWTGGPHGLARFDGSTWRHFDTKDGLNSDSVTELAAMSGEEVWVLYRNLVGLTRFRLVDGKPEARHFGLADGFPSDTFYALGIDSEGRIWAGGNSGVSVMDAQGVVRTYDRH
ncbi:MAG: hypothetical protein JRG91_19510, partial [Deltaproteobacteria bacterium]|nr:hypothetical protein [Deltaproteobacteria bacterium]